MTTTLAQILGIIFAVAGVSMFTNKKGILSLMEESAHQKGLLWLTGFIVLVFGAIILTMNNTWTSGLISLITVVGWLCVLKGIMLTCFPNFAISIYKKWVSAGLLSLSGLVALILGLVLLYKGFM